MSDYLSDLLAELGSVAGAAPVPEERLDEFSDKLPPLLIDLWRTVGFAGFGDGKLWLCDPVAWRVPVDAWTRDLPGKDQWHAVTRGAFGKLTLWGERTGLSLVVEPVHGLLYEQEVEAEAMDSAEEWDLQIFSHLYMSLDGHDLLGADGAPLFERAMAAHGRVAPDSMYAFFPAIALGGALAVSQVEVVDAVTHVTLLADLAASEPS